MRLIRVLLSSLTLCTLALRFTPCLVAQEQNERPPTLCVLLPLSGAHKSLGENVARILGDGAETKRFDTATRDFAGIMQRAKESGCVLAIGGIGDMEAKALAEAADTYAQWFLALGRVHVPKAGSNVVWARSSTEEVLQALLDFAIKVEGIRSLLIIQKNEAYYRSISDIVFALGQSAGIRTARCVLGKDEENKVAKDLTQWLGADDLPSAGVFLALDTVSARRLLGFMEFYELSNNQRKGVLVIGPPSWYYESGLVRSLGIFDGAIIAAVSDGGFECEIKDAKSLAISLLQDPELVSKRSLPLSVVAEGLEFVGCSGKLVVKRGEVTGRSVRLFRVTHGGLESLSER